MSIPIGNIHITRHGGIGKMLIGFGRYSHRIGDEVQNWNYREYGYCRPISAASLARVLHAMPLLDRSDEPDGDPTELEDESIEPEDAALAIVLAGNDDRDEDHAYDAWIDRRLDQLE